MNNTLKTYKIGCTSLAFPPTTFKSGYKINPTAIPVAILDVNGIIRTTINVEKASSNCAQSTFLSPAIIKLPTIISAGAVIASKEEIAATNGEKTNVTKNKIATTSDVRPVLPPTATPDVDSIYAVAGVVPTVAPSVVATA